MYLENKENESLQLDIVGYEFPNLRDNWLLVSIHAKLKAGEWSATAPAIDTTEVEHLIRWLESIRRGEATKDRMLFTEPNLEFELCLVTTQRLRIYFELEMRLNWAKEKLLYKHDLWFEIDLNLDTLDYMISDLTEQLARFPTRVEDTEE